MVDRRFLQLSIIFLFLFLLVLSAGCGNVFGRTVALVYDDSTSMLKDNKWSYANYAVQVLAAFLDDRDTLFFVRMNSNRGVETFRHGNQRSNSILRIAGWDKPGANQVTPYGAVQTAAEIFLNGSNRAPQSLGEEKSDWLIIITDGIFDEQNGAVSRDTVEKAEQDANNFFSSPAGRTTRVAFLLIGKGATGEVADKWKKEGGEQVEILRTTRENLVAGMGKIVSMIAGRDRQFKFTSKGNNVRFTSVFPVRRITMFLQGTSTSIPRLQKVVLPDNSGRPSTEVLDVHLQHFPQTGGKIIHLTRRGSMPSGEYTLEFNNTVKKQHLQLFVEPAVAFKVAVRRAENNGVIARTGPEQYALCRGDKVKFTVTFRELNGGQPTTLEITPEIAENLRVTGRLNSKKLSFGYDRSNHDYRSKPWVVHEGSTSLSLEARYPGYFHFRSNLITITGEDCERKLTITSDHIKVAVQYTGSAEFVPTGLFTLIRRGDDYQGKHFLQVPKLPKGVALEIAGKRISRRKDRIEIPLELGKSLSVTVLTNKSFSPKKDVTFSLKLTTDNTHVKQTKPLAITLRLKPRKLALVPAVGQWRASFEQLGRAEGPLFAMTINGRKISPARTGEFTLSVSTAKRIRLTIEPIPGTSSFRVRVRPALFSCRTDTGRLPMKLTMKSRIPGESITSQFDLVVDDTDWWTKCHRMVFILAAILLFLAYVVALIKKRRFARGGVVTYERQYRQLRIKPRPEMYYLAGWRAEDDGNRLFNFLCRWLLPFVPERRAVRGITLEAGQSDHVIILPPEQQRANMTIGLAPLDKPGARPEPVSLRTTLEVKGDSQIERYTYDKI